MDSLSYRRLDTLEAEDLAVCQHVFRRAPSFVYPTGGRPATDEDVEKMLRHAPSGVHAADVHVCAIDEDGVCRGCYVVLRGYPDGQTAYLALLLLVEAAQGRSLGVRALRHIESEARSWGCTALAAAVDSRNDRALRFWLKQGFVEEFRKVAAGFMGDAVGIRKHGL